MKIKAEAILGGCGTCQRPRRTGPWSEQGQVEWGARPGLLASWLPGWLQTGLGRSLGVAVFARWPDASGVVPLSPDVRGPPFPC